MRKVVTGNACETWSRIECAFEQQFINELASQLGNNIDAEFIDAYKANYSAV